MKQTLITLRKHKMKTQEQASTEMGISFMSLRNLEDGKGNPRMKTAMKIANYYGVGLDAIDWFAKKEKDLRRAR